MRDCQDFPDGPVVNTPCSMEGGTASIPGELRFCVLHGAAKKKWGTIVLLWVDPPQPSIDLRESIWVTYQQKAHFLWWRRF